MGALPIAIPLTSTEPPSDPSALAEVVRGLATFDWLVVTSARTVDPLTLALRASGLTPETLGASRLRVCAVGPRTGAALSEIGLTPHLIPDRFHAEGVADALVSAGDPRGLRILFPRAEEGRDLIPRLLREAGAEVETVAAYRTVPDEVAGASLCRLVARRGVDALTFTAGSAARVFADAWARTEGLDGVTTLPEGIGVFALGPATASALDERGIQVHGVAIPHTMEGLVSSLQEWFSLIHN